MKSIRKWKPNNNMRLICNFLLAVCFTIHSTAKAEANNVDTGSRLVAHCFAHRGTNNQWWKYDSIHIAYEYPSDLRYGSIYYFSSPSVIKWRNNSREDYYYTGTSNPDSIITYSWDGSTFNSNKKKTLHTDGVARVTEIVQEEWDTISNNYVNSTRETFTYNFNNAPSSDTWQVWSATKQSWSNFWRVLYTRKSNDKIISEVRQAWDTTQNTWINLTKNDTIYDNQYMLISAAYTWDPLSATWVGISRNVYHNDLSTRPLGADYEEWDPATNGWTQKGRHTYSYDAVGNISADLFETYLVTLGSFDTTCLDTYTYNNFKQLIAHTKVYWQSGQWVITNQAAMELYYYVASIPEGVSTGRVPTVEFTISPVPADNFISVSVRAEKEQRRCLYVTDFQGRILLKQTIPSTKTFKDKLAISGLPGGNYLMIIQDENGNRVVQRFAVHH